jgi:hypothetical protein
MLLMLSKRRVKAIFAVVMRFLSLNIFFIKLGEAILAEFLV